MKWVLDGTPLERGAALRTGYADKPNWQGQLDLSPGRLKSVVQRAWNSSDQKSKLFRQRSCTETPVHCKKAAQLFQMTISAYHILYKRDIASAAPIEYAVSHDASLSSRTIPIESSQFWFFPKCGGISVRVSSGRHACRYFRPKRGKGRTRPWSHSQLHLFRVGLADALDDRLQDNCRSQTYDGFCALRSCRSRSAGSGSAASKTVQRTNPAPAQGDSPVGRN